MLLITRKLPFTSLGKQTTRSLQQHQFVPCCRLEAVLSLPVIIHQPRGAAQVLRYDKDGVGGGSRGSAAPSGSSTASFHFQNDVAETTPEEGLKKYKSPVVSSGLLSSLQQAWACWTCWTCRLNQPAPPSSLQPAPPSSLQQCAGPLPLFPTDNRASVDSSGVQGRTTAELGQQHSCVCIHQSQ